MELGMVDGNQQYHSDIWASPRFNGDAFMEQAMLSQVHWMLIALQQLPQAAVFSGIQTLAETSTQPYRIT
ncbi:hypothetical protein E4U46_007681 [Claviceps purpurea]|nr:hypothetical protein E4U46_007681 [Claviceps purpurea]